jgi:hypothetical protein
MSSKKTETAVTTTATVTGAAPLATLPPAASGFAIGLPAAPPARVPYIGHRSSAGDSKNEDRAAALDEVGITCPSYYLFDGEPIKLAPFQCHLLRADWFYTKQNPQGKVVAVRLDDTQEGRDNQFYPHLFGVFGVVVAPGTFVAATGKFRSAQTGGFRYDVLPAFNKYNDPATAKLSANHAAAMKAVHPGGRFRITLWSEEKEIDNGTLIVGKCRVNVTPAAEVEAFNKWFTDTGKASLWAALTNHEKAINELRELLAGSKVKQVGK